MKTGRLWLYSLFCKLLPETRLFGLKAGFLRWCGADIGKNVRICSSVCFYGCGTLSIGDDVWIGHRTMISTGIGGNVMIGDCVDISDNVLIATGSHKIDTAGPHSAGVGEQKSVFILNGVWIGMGAILLHGIEIGEKAIVGAGAVVVSDCDSKSVYVGVPAKKIRSF